METKRPAFSVIFTPEEKGGFTVTVPAVPECISYGETFEEASRNVREALLLCLEHRRDSGDEVPVQTEEAVLSSISFSPEELNA